LEVEERVLAQVTADPRSPLVKWVRAGAIAIFVSVPIALLTASAISWLRTGIDMPVGDDWRIYLDARADSLDPAYLFTPQNDTLYPVGKFLDVVAHVAFGGNAIVYQLLSMVLVLGSLLALQWVLLRTAFRDTLYAAIAFSVCALMLITDSYWGGPNMAYHQALPLVAILAALVVALRPVGPSWLAIVVGFLLGLLAGMTYVSGAFAAVTAGGVMVLIGRLGFQSSRRRVLLVGVGLTISGLVTVALQLLAVRALQSDDSMAGNPLTYPWQPDFWYYIAGKVGASLGSPVTRPRVALVITLAAVVAAVMAVAWSLRGIRRDRPEPPRADVVSVVTLTLAATIVVYLMLVAAGRSSLRPSGGPAAPIEVFQFGFFRFHFFWVTLLWPWVAAVGLAVIPTLGRRSTWLRSVALGLAALTATAAVAVATATGAFDFETFYRRWAVARMETYRCLLESVQRGDGYECTIWEPMNPARLIVYAKSVDASFAEYLQTLPVAPPMAPLFSMADPSSGSVQLLDATVIEENGPGELTLDAGVDAQLIISVRDEEAMRQCLVLEVRAMLHPSRLDVSQAFYRRPEDQEFSPERVATTEIAPGDTGSVPLSLQLSSDAGFSGVVRFDPVFNPQTVGLDGLELYCRWSAG
jgi:hypothetical protein